MFHPIILPIALLFLMAGCTTTLKLPPTTTIQIAAQTATAITLSEGNSSVADAQRIVELATSVEAATTDPSAPFNFDAARALIIQMIVDNWSGQKQLLYTAAIAGFLDVIIAQARDSDIQLDETASYVRATAIGVRLGAQLFIATESQPPSD